MWILSYLAIGLGAVRYKFQKQPTENEDCSQKSWYMNLPINPLIPIFFIMIAYIIVVWVFYTESDIFEGILLTAGFIIFLVMIRQLLVLENLKRTNRRIKCQYQIKTQPNRIRKFPQRKDRSIKRDSSSC